MSAECFPITILPHVSAIYREYLRMAETDADARVRAWYGSEPFTGRWMGHEVSGGKDARRLADALLNQNRTWGAGAAALENIEKLRGGARAVVTGQQVGLLGGPLLTLLKAATAVARAREATAKTGVEHVPVFWLATEDHDLPEVDQAALLTKTTVETLRAGLNTANPVEVGGVTLGPEMEPVLEKATELLAWAPLCDLLRSCWAPGQTMGGAFARWMAAIFADEGLIVLDAAGREFHSLGERALRFAIEHGEELERALIARSEALVEAGFHAQVLVAEGHSLLFLVDGETGARQALRRTEDGGWKAGRREYSSADLLHILKNEPERLSPNALLRPVFQDTILPTAAYVGGPAEVAYFAQSAVVYEQVLGRVTPVLPRLTATLLEPQIAAAMERDEVQLPDAMTSADELAQRLGARAMPIELKRRLASVGNAMDRELGTLTEYLGGLDQSLGRAADTAGSKMRYQMNRLRRLAATHELEKEASLRKHAEAITLNVFPGGHPQERVVSGAWYLARYEGLPSRFVAEAKGMCGGHSVIRL